MKRDLIQRMAYDPNVGDREFRVAYVMMTEGSGSPTQMEIAAALGRTIRAVERAIAALVRSGWLSVERPDRTQPNIYDFHLPVEGRASARSNIDRAAKSPHHAP